MTEFPFPFPAFTKPLTQCANSFKRLETSEDLRDCGNIEAFSNSDYEKM